MWKVKLNFATATRNKVMDVSVQHRKNLNFTLNIFRGHKALEIIVITRSVPASTLCLNMRTFLRKSATINLIILLYALPIVATFYPSS